jgi:hypothetical protein
MQARRRAGEARTQARGEARWPPGHDESGRRAPTERLQASGVRGCGARQGAQLVLVSPTLELETDPFLSNAREQLIREAK